MFGFLNLTQWQQAQIMRLVMLNITTLQTNIMKYVHLDLDDTQILKLLLWFFDSRHQLIMDDVMETVILICKNKTITKPYISVALDTALGNNYFGQLFKQYNSPVITKYISEQPQFQNYLSILLDSQYKTSQAEILYKKRSTKKYLFSRNLKTFKSKTQYLKKFKEMQQLQQLDIQFTKTNIAKYQSQSQRNVYIEELIEALLSNKYTDQVKNNIYYLLQYIFCLGIKRFNQQIKLTDAKTLLKAVVEGNIISPIDLDIKSVISPLIKQSQLHFYFNEKFQLQDINDNQIISLLSRTAQQLLRVSANQYILIISNVKNNQIYKVIADGQQDVQLLTQLIENLDLNDIFDVIYTGHSPLIQYLPIRYLNYIPNKNGEVITLKYPETLVSASIQSIIVTNLSKCVNLQNLYSYKIAYTDDCFNVLENLQCFCSCYDTYQQKGALLSNISNKNKLQYIHVYLSKGIVELMNVCQKFSNLRYFYIYTDTQPIQLQIFQSQRERIETQEVIISSWYSVQWEPKEVPIQYVLEEDNAYDQDVLIDCI